MSSLPLHYASPMHLPFNRSCLDGQFVLQSPDDNPGAPGYGVLLRGNNIVTEKQGKRFVLPHGKWSDEATLYLGRWQGQPCYLLDQDEVAKLPENFEKCGLLDENPQLPIDLLTLGGMGRMILHWQERSRFCGSCGQPTDGLGGEWGRSCPSCRAQFFPALHPCAIVLVTRPGEVLLTRKPAWAANRYSLVAGFQEFGESLEETAIREIAEETGIIANNVRYVGSQSWPFPSQTMVGFVADYVEGEVKVDTTELADARWFPVDDLPSLPPRRSIARYILDKALTKATA